MKKQDKKWEKVVRNKKWNENQALINNAYKDLISKLERCPTILEIAEKTGLNRNTISKHSKDIKLETYINSSLRSLTPDVLVSIYNSARKGVPASQKLWVQLMEGWREGLDVTTGGEKLIDWKIEAKKKNGNK